MDIYCQGLRDRRIAASDETTSVLGGNSHIYRANSVARDRGAVASAGGAARYDRSVNDITTIILHQTSGNTFVDRPRQVADLANPSQDASVRGHSMLDRIAAHFVVLRDGSIFYTHDVQYLINSAGGSQGIDIEVAGSFPHSDAPNPSQRLPEVAIRALRTLVAQLASQLRITHIHPHGQVQVFRAGSPRCGSPGNPNKYESCPGPDIWVNVGEWACRPRPVGLGLVSATPLSRYPNHGIAPAQANPAYDQHLDEIPA